MAKPKPISLQGLNDINKAEDLTLFEPDHLRAGANFIPTVANR
jgi:hypothetical protein